MQESAGLGGWSRGSLPVKPEMQQHSLRKAVVEKLKVTLASPQALLRSCSLAESMARSCTDTAWPCLPGAVFRRCSQGENMRFGYKDSCFPGFMNQDNEFTSRDNPHGHAHLKGRTFLTSTSLSACPDIWSLANTGPNPNGLAGCQHS